MKIIRFLNWPHPISRWFFFWPGMRWKRDSVAFSGFFSLMSEINFTVAFSNFRIWLSAKWYENIITGYTNIVLAHLGQKISRFNYHFKATDSKWGKKRHDIQIYNKKWRSYVKTKGKKIKYWWCLGAKRKLDNYFLIGTFILMISKAQLDHWRYPSEIKLIISSYLRDINNAVRWIQNTSLFLTLLTYKFTTKSGEVMLRLRVRKLNIDGVWARKEN